MPVTAGCSAGSSLLVWPAAAVPTIVVVLVRVTGHAGYADATATRMGMEDALLGGERQEFSPPVRLTKQMGKLMHELHI